MASINMDKILLTPKVVGEYFKFAEEVAEKLAQSGIKGDQIPDEQIIETHDGGLEVFVILNDENKTKISFPIGPDEWAWAE